MKKVVIISLLAQILWGSDDYLPVSKLTDEKKYELKITALLVFANTCPFEKELSLFGFALNRL